jgi:transcriptional regulator with XRE-family HTH domain
MKANQENMIMSRCIRPFSVLLFVAFAALRAAAQVQTGTPAFESFGGGPDTINLANLNTHISVPVLHKAGRGTNFTYDLSYDSSVWYPVGNPGSQVWTPVSNWGWRGVTEVVTGYVSYNYWTSQCEGDDLKLHPFYVWDAWQYHDAFGTIHSFPNAVLVRDTWSCSNINQQSTDTATNGSGYSINAVTSTNVKVYQSNGKAITAPLNLQSGSASFVDRNGNELTVDTSGHFYDTLSSITPVLTVAGSGTPTSPMTFTYVAPSGANAPYTMKYTAETLTLLCPLYKLTLMEGIGPYIRKRRDELDLSLREFAKKLDCSPAFISDIELGRRHPSDEVLVEMARVLKVKVEELRAMDVRAPIDAIKRITLDDPTFALALRSVIDKKITADELLEFVKKKEHEKQGKHKK